MNLSSITRAWILSGAVLAAACGQEKQMAVENDMRVVTSQRFSELDTRFEKAGESARKLIERLQVMDHPLNNDDAGVDIKLLGQNVLMKSADAEALLFDVSQRLRRDRAQGYKGVMESFQECSHLLTYYEKPHISLEELDAMASLPVFDRMGGLFDQAMKSQGLLYGMYGSGSFSDPYLASSHLDDYEQKISAFEQEVKEAAPVVEDQRRALIDPFMTLWEKNILLDLGIDQCNKRYKVYLGKAAADGFVPK